MTDTVLQLEGVSFAYTSGPFILENISLKVTAGEYVVITGPNGAAKTTLLKLMAGLLIPQQGRVHLSSGQEGKPPALGYVPQKSAFNPGFPATVDEVLRLHAGRRCSPSLLKETLELVKLPDKSRHLLGTLSGGQFQRVLIACALIRKPQLLFLDEPFTSLDSQTQADLLALLSSLHQQGITLIMVTHDLTPVLPYASRLLRVNHGKISL